MRREILWTTEESEKCALESNVLGYKSRRNEERKNNDHAEEFETREWWIIERIDREKKLKEENSWRRLEKGLTIKEDRMEKKDLCEKKKA